MLVINGIARRARGDRAINESSRKPQSNSGVVVRGQIRNRSVAAVNSLNSRTHGGQAVCTIHLVYSQKLTLKPTDKTILNDR